ncbi:MAG TPA: PKD domain-containing protein [Dehalococcoidia bacterium]|nr:PKD domain-containing protein [Dehalococcoidia bacterium]
MSQSCHWAKWTTGSIIAMMLLGSACTLFSPPPPPPPPPEPENQLPVIHYMTAKKQTTPSTNCQILCVATDKDDDVLSYWWSADGGMIQGSGENITWIAPDSSGNYTVKVMVTDGKGGEAIDSVSITVTPKPNQPPIITMTVTPKDQPTIIDPADQPTQVGRWSTTSIECIAEDPDGDELSFTWSATEGKVEGEGAKVQYIASSIGDHAVTVTVTDGRGGETIASVYFKVPCCGH